MTAALPKRIVKETERLIAEPYVHFPSLRLSSFNESHPPEPLTACSWIDMDSEYRVPGISAVPHEDNLRYFDVNIHGPSQSPYEGESFPVKSYEFALLKRTARGCL